MSSFFSSDGSFSLQFAIIFLVIFAILAVGVFALRGLTGKGRAHAPKAGARGRQPRLGIVDIYELDRQRQLILLRRDNVEHLLLVGGPNDVVIERNITRGLGARLSSEDSAEAEPQPQAAQTPDFGQPPEFGQSPAVPYLEAQREPSFEMPVVVPPPVPGSDAPPPQIGRPLDVSARPDYVPPPLSPAEAPVAAPPRRESALARVIRRTPPSLTNLVPGAGAERVRLPEAPRPPAPEPVPETSVPAPIPAPGTGRAIDAAILSDMARQLEEALRRPSAAVRPAAPLSATPEPEPVATQAEPAEPEPAAPEPAAAFVPAHEPAPEPEAAATAAEPEVDPVAAGMAATSEPREPVADPEPVLPPVAPAQETAAPESARQEPGRQESGGQEPERQELEVSRLDIADATSAPVEPDEPPQHEPAAPEPAPPVFVEPAPTAKPAASPNPFSVEEIEAEFARLLGRPLDRKS